MSEATIPKEIATIGQCAACIDKLLLGGLYIQARAICDDALSNPESVGCVNDYHNLSASFYLHDDYVYALKVAQAGINLYPYNVDLLSDIVLYGFNCGKDVSQYYEMLLKTSRSVWNWRTYCYIIDYLMSFDSLTNDEALIKEKQCNALNLAEEFVSSQPAEAHAYLKLYNVRSSFVNRLRHEGAELSEIDKTNAAACSVLKDAIINKKITSDMCVREYIKSLQETRDYNEIVESCDVLLQSINISDVDLLVSVMFARAYAFGHLLSKGVKLVDDVVNSIYNDMYRILFLSKSEYFDQVRTYVIMLSRQTGQQIPDDLLELTGIPND